MFNNQGGGDGSVYRTTGSRARAFTVRSNGIEYSGAMCFPPSSDAKPYYSELEANKGVQAIADEIEINCPPPTAALLKASSAATVMKIIYLVIPFSFLL